MCAGTLRCFLLWVGWVGWNIRLDGWVGWAV